MYRLSDSSGLTELAFDEYLDGGGVVVIEWADRIADALPAERLDITLIADDAADGRRLLLTGRGARGQALVREFSGEETGV